MSEKRKLILITNDDGVRAEGLRLLVETVKPLADVIVLAPEEQQSGKSSSVSVGHHLALRLVSKEPGVEVYATGGTPVDCVKLAFYSVCKDRRPDLLLSGINKGSNSSISVVYSGTMGAAIEGCIFGVPSVGLSQCFVPDASISYEHGLPLVKTLVEDMLGGKILLPEGVCLNVNFPHGAIEGPLQWCRQAKGKWICEFTRDVEVTPDGSSIYTMGGEYLCQDDGTDTDEYVLAHHGASCVPQTVDMTANLYLETILKDK